MYEFLTELLRDLVRGRPRPDVARFCAYFLAPAAILSLCAGNIDGSPMGLDLAAPVTVAVLQTEVGTDGSTVSRKGIAVVVEPPSADLRIPIDRIGSRMWTSLSEADVLANRDRLFIDGSGLVSRAPLVGVDAPVAVVVDGQVGNTIQTVGGSDPISNWTATSRRSMSIVSGILLACVFAFGMAIAATAPQAEPNQH